MWYCVHALHFFELKQEPQSEFTLWEHMYLIKAGSADEARDKGARRAKQDETESFHDALLGGKLYNGSST